MKQKFGDKIYINGMQRKRADQIQWACNVCDIALLQVVLAGLIFTIIHQNCYTKYQFSTPTGELKLDT